MAGPASRCLALCLSHLHGHGSLQTDGQTVPLHHLTVICCCQAVVISHTKSHILTTTAIEGRKGKQVQRGPKDLPTGSRSQSGWTPGLWAAFGSGFPEHSYHSFPVPQLCK
jgi:hypothetical protein